MLIDHTIVVTTFYVESSLTDSLSHYVHRNRNLTSWEEAKMAATSNDDYKPEHFQAVK